MNEQGLHYLHQRGYVHQDVKPGNVLLTAERFAKLADFGLTVAVHSLAAGGGEDDGGLDGGDAAAVYGGAVAVGTARYWPPELWGAESELIVCGVTVGLAFSVYTSCDDEPTNRTERRDAKGRGDVWGLGLTLLALINGKEPLEGCTTRSQVEIELFEAGKEGPSRPCALLLVSSHHTYPCLTPLHTTLH